MYAIISAAILTAAIIVICLILISVAVKQKDKRIHRLLKRFSELGTAYNLSYSSQEILTNGVIGLDGMNRKLVFLTEVDRVSFLESVIDLNEVKKCTVRKVFSNTRWGIFRNRQLPTYVESISLNFEFHNGKDPVEIPFYNHLDNPVFHPDDMEQKAERCKQMLTKMLKSPLKKIA